MENLRINSRRIQVSANVDLNLFEAAKKFGIGWTDALEFGIKFKLAENGNDDYPLNKLSSNIRKLTELVEEKSKEIEKLKEQLPKQSQEEINKQVEEDFKGAGI